MLTGMSAVFNTTSRILTTSGGGVIDPYSHADVDETDPAVADALVAGYLVPAGPPAPLPPDPGDDGGQGPVVDVPSPAPKPKSAKPTATPVEE